MRVREALEDAAPRGFEAYDEPAVAWSRSDWVQAKTMLHDRYLFDRETNQWTVSRYLEDLTERYGEWDLGIVFGAGVLVPAGEQLLMVEAHWVHGVVDLDSNTDSDLDMFNRGLIFRGGLLFPLAIRAGKPQPAP